MNHQPPPRPSGVGRPGTARRPPERSISPAPEAQRRPAIIPDQTAVIDTEWSDDPVAVRAADEREELLRAQHAENARLKVELERKSRVPELPSPRTARERATEWPPQSVPAPGYRPRQESNVNLHVVLEREARERAESLAPKSGRQRAGEAMRSPLAKVLGLLLGALGAGSGGNLVADAIKPGPAPAASAAGEVYPALKEPIRNLALSLSENDRADRAAVDWAKGEIEKLNKRVRVLERKLKRDPGDELDPEAPPTAPPPPKAPDLPERL